MTGTQILDSEILKITRELINKGTRYDLEYLNKTYDDELIFVRMNREGEVIKMSKKDNLEFFGYLKDSGAEPLNDYSEFHYADNDGKNGFVMLTRRMKQGAEEEEFLFNIYWEKKHGSWKIIRESVFQK